MDTQRTDFLVGLFVLVIAGVVIGTLIVASDLGVVRNDLYVRLTSAQALSSDTRVLLQGLQVGRVREVNPVRDPTTQQIQFVARLAVQDRFPNGTELTLPVGTRAVVSQPTPIEAAVINLVVPADPVPGRVLDPGDTVPSERTRSALDQMGEIARELQGRLEGMVTETRELLHRTTAAVGQTQRLLATNGPLVEDVLGRLATTLEQTERVIADVAPRIGPLHDSLSATLTHTRQLLTGLDTLVSTAQGIAVDNRDVVREIAASLRRSALVLEHFTDQISRRPTRLFTGVEPPDTLRTPR